jgi:hypothetical protein
MTACDKELSNILKQGSNYFLISKPILLESAGRNPRTQEAYKRDLQLRRGKGTPIQKFKNIRKA